MKNLLMKLAIPVLIYMLRQEVVHNQLRALADRTDNEFDDAGVEALVSMFKRIADLLEAKPQ